MCLTFCTGTICFLRTVCRVVCVSYLARASSSSSEPCILLTVESQSQITHRHHLFAHRAVCTGRVNALCNLSRKKSREVAASLPGRFLSRRCITLCITMEAEPRTAKQYKCHHCCSCKNYRGGKKVWKGWEKSVFASFFGRSEDRVLGHPIAQAASYCLLPDTF